MNNILKSAIVMGLVALVASFALSHVNNITEPRIKKQEIEKQQNALSDVLPGYSIKEEKSVTSAGNSMQFWIAERTDGSGEIELAYAFIAEKSGYSGNVRSMVGVDKDFNILGIAILQQSETPGLGACCIDIPASDTFIDAIFGSGSSNTAAKRPWFQEQFKGLNLGKPVEIVKKGNWNESMKDELLEKNAVSAITGATITTRAVTNSIEAGINILKEYLQSAKIDENMSPGAKK